MIYRFTIVSDEVDDFLREIKIDAEATFLDFCTAILGACNYSDDQITSFYITDDDWERQGEVTREDMGNSAADEDLYVMADTKLRDILEDENQRMTFLFDTFNRRFLYIELKEIIPGKDLKKAECSRSRGDAPQQIIAEPQKPVTKGQQATEESGENFYGSDEFNEEDLDTEGLDISDDIPY